MRPDWELPERQLLYTPLDRQIKEVLIEYNGPQLVVVTEPDGDHLALAVDEDGAVVRWLQVPISKLEYAALLSGGQPLREAFKKPRVTVVDYPHSSPEAPFVVWHVEDWEDIPNAVLPVQGALLPYTKGAERTEPVVRVSGAGAALDGATFAQLAAALGTLHETWIAILQYIFGVANPRPISAYAATHGSLELKVHADDAIQLEQVISYYETLVRASQNADALGSVLQTTSPSVVKVYKKHLTALDKQKVEVLAEWRGGSVFLGHGTAEAALASFPTSDATPMRIETRPHRGHFGGFWASGRRWRFSFYDVDANEEFQGKIGRDIRREWAREQARDPVLVGSPQRKYLIDVAETEDANGAVIDRSLVRFSPID